MKLTKCPDSGLILPSEFIDHKRSLKKCIESYVDSILNDYQHISQPYFITFHAKFDPLDPSVFTIDAPKLTTKLPPFISNSLVYWVNNKSGIHELLWMVAPKKPGEKLHVEFNTEGVAYLQAKGAMAS